MFLENYILFASLVSVLTFLPVTLFGNAKSIKHVYCNLALL